MDCVIDAHRCCLYPVDRRPSQLSFFFFNDTATTEIYTLSLHDALPICWSFWTLSNLSRFLRMSKLRASTFCKNLLKLDRKSTRLNSSHQIISYAVFCLKKKNYTDTSLNDSLCPSAATDSVGRSHSQVSP